MPHRPSSRTLVVHAPRCECHDSGRTHYTNDSCPGGHRDLPNCPTRGSNSRSTFMRQCCVTWPNFDPWHREKAEEVKG